MEREHYPFRCGKCGNWYTPIQVAFPCPDHDKHAVNKAGRFDCHWEHDSATTSERRIVEIEGIIRTSIATSKGGDLAAAETAFVAAEKAESEATTGGRRGQGVVGDSDIMEMPGLKGANPEARFKTADAIARMVDDNRRPKSDLDVLNRSFTIVGEIAGGFPALMAEVREAIGEMRRAVTEPVDAEQGRKDRMTKVRAARKTKEPVAEPAGVAT